MTPSVPPIIADGISRALTIVDKEKRERYVFKRSIAGNTEIRKHWETLNRVSQKI
jgi:hypothetical protein